MALEEGSEATLVFVLTWDQDTVRRACAAVLSKYRGEGSRYSAVLGQLVSVFGPSMSLGLLVGGSHVFCDSYIEFAGSGYREMLVEYPIVDLWLLKRCLQKCASVVFASLDPFLAEFIVVRLKGAEQRLDGIQTCFETCSCFRGLFDAFSGGVRVENGRCLAPDCLFPEGDRTPARQQLSRGLLYFICLLPYLNP